MKSSKHVFFPNVFVHQQEQASLSSILWWLSSMLIYTQNKTKPIILLYQTASSSTQLSWFLAASTKHKKSDLYAQQQQQQAQDPNRTSKSRSNDLFRIQTIVASESDWKRWRSFDMAPSIEEECFESHGVWCEMVEVGEEHHVFVKMWMRTRAC